MCDAHELTRYSTFDGTELMANISFNNYRLPTTEDFSGAATALQRLQDTYKLSVTDLASGKIGESPSVNLTGIIYEHSWILYSIINNTPFLAEDCYLIGLQSYAKEDWAMARDWMKEALYKYDQGDIEGVQIRSRVC